MDAKQTARQQLLIDKQHSFLHMRLGKRGKQKKIKHCLHAVLFVFEGKVKEMPCTRLQPISVIERYLPGSSQISQTLEGRRKLNQKLFKPNSDPYLLWVSLLAERSSKRETSQPRAFARSAIFSHAKPTGISRLFMCHRPDDQPLILYSFKHLTQTSVKISRAAEATVSILQKAVRILTSLLLISRRD